MGYTSYVKVPVYMSDTTLGPVSVTAGASGHLLLTVWADGSTPNDLRSKINRGDLIRLGDPFTGPLFRVSLTGDFTATTVALATVNDPYTCMYSVNRRLPCPPACI